jgi:hypothetical protein
VGSSFRVTPTFSTDVKRFCAEGGCIMAIWVVNHLANYGALRRSSITCSDFEH